MTGSSDHRELSFVGIAPRSMDRWTQAGDEAFDVPTLEDLYRAHATDVFRLVSRLLGPTATHADVDDLVQEVFMTVDRALSGFRGDGTPFSFVYGVTTRVVMRHLRSRRRYREMIDRFEAGPVARPAAPPDPAETAEQRELVHRVWGALLRIKADRRIVFVLANIEGRTAPEIAEMLDLSEEAVRSRLRRARTELEQRLARSGVQR